MTDSLSLYKKKTDRARRCPVRERDETRERERTEESVVCVSCVVSYMCVCNVQAARRCKDHTSDKVAAYAMGRIGPMAAKKPCPIQLDPVPLNWTHWTVT